jgi:SNF2 family DNA or RNA helicase/predicted RNA methylase
MPKKLTLNQTFNEKGGRFDETMLDNTEDLFLSASNFDKKNLQQYYTPKKFAEFLAECLPVSLSDKAGRGNFIFDATSGNGNLLLPFIKNYNNVCCGIEIDNNNIPAEYPGNMKFLNADFVKLSKFMNDLGVNPAIMVLNPPFGLKWTENEIESQEFLLRYAIENLAYLGCGYMICTKVFADKVFSLNKFDDIRKYINVRIDVQNLFIESNVGIDTAVLFFSRSEMEPLNFEFSYLEVTKTKLKSIANQINFALSENTYSAQYDISVNWETYDLIEGCYQEYKRLKAKNIFDVNLENGKIYLNLTNYKWYKIKTENNEFYKSLKEIHLKTANYLAFNTKLQKDLRILLEDEILTISPEAQAEIDHAIRDSELLITPFKALPPQQRLGYLADHSVIKCIKNVNDDGKIFKAGERYDLSTSTHINQLHYSKEITVKGEDEIRNFSKEVKGLKISIGTGDNQLDLTEAAEHIRFLTEHFEIPNPMDVATKFPDIHKQMEARLRSEEFEKYTFKEYQIYDLSRAAIKDALILSWDQGGGKSRGALAWSELKNAKKCIVICPQDLVVQWVKEAKKFNIHLQPIRNGEQAMEALYSEQGYWVTYYEFLSLIDTENDYKTKYLINIGKFEDGKLVSSRAIAKDTASLAEHINSRWKDYMAEATKITYKTKFFRGWGYVLKNAFDTVIVDEGVKIKTKDAKRGIAIRRFKAKNKLLLSGSPIKNMFVDIYYLFGWLFGYQSSRFPYDYNDRAKFLNDYGTFEKMYTHRDERDRPPKLLPEINQISLFWKLISPCILRRKKDDFGEELVSKKMHRIACDFNFYQHEQYKWWDANFDKWFIRTHPDFDMSKVTNSKILGLLWKYRFTTTAPHSPKVSGPDMYYNPNPFTNKILACLQIVNEVLNRDEQIIIFTNLQENADFLKNLFGSKSMVANGKFTPKKRSPIIESFKNGTYPILIAGTEAVNLGHSLENCSNLIMMDFVWEHSTTRQAIDRIHRINSLKDVNIYLLYVKGSYDEVMIDMIDKKGMSSDYALDGELVDQDHMQIDHRMLYKESVRLFSELKQTGFVKEDLVEVECRRLLEEIRIPRGRRTDISTLFKKPSSPITETHSVTKTFGKKRIRIQGIETESLFD